MPTQYEWDYEEMYYEDFSKKMEERQEDGWEVFAVHSDVCTSLGSTRSGEEGFRVIFRRAPNSSFPWEHQEQDGMV